MSAITAARMRGRYRQVQESMFAARDRVRSPSQRLRVRQIAHLLDQRAPRHCVLVDAGYGIEKAFREQQTALGMSYIVGVTGGVTELPPEREPQTPLPYSGKGRVPVLPTARRREHPAAEGAVAQGTGIRAGATALCTPSLGESARTPSCARDLPPNGRLLTTWSTARSHLRSPQYCALWLAGTTNRISIAVHARWRDFARTHGVGAEIAGAPRAFQEH